MRSYYVRRKEHTAFQLKNLIPSVKHGGGSIMAWACFAASWPGQPAIIDGTMNSELYQQILKENVSQGRSQGTDLSLATPLATLLKTAVVVPFFLTRNRCIFFFLHPHRMGDFSDAHFSFASAPGPSQMSAEKVGLHQPNELQ